MTLEILVVEDGEENIEAATEFFSSLEGVSVDYARTYKEAVEKLDSKVYAGAIVDLNFPMAEGCEPGYIGEQLGKKLDIMGTEYRTPYVFLTAGLGHHNNPTALIYTDIFAVNDDKRVEAHALKSEPNAYEAAYRELIDSVGGLKILQETYGANKRRRK